MRLETERLVLRPLSIADLDALAEFYADPETMRYMGSRTTLDLEQTRASLERMISWFEADGFGQLAVERRQDGAFIGRCGLLVWDPASWTPTRPAEANGPIEIEVGYLLGRDYWGQGYATEAASAVRDWALEHLELERLIALIMVGNERSSGASSAWNRTRKWRRSVAAWSSTRLGTGPRDRPGLRVAGRGCPRATPRS